MRKILGSEDRARKSKRNKIIWGIFLAVIMILSTLGYAFYSSLGSIEPEVVVYQDIEFKETNYGTWQFTSKYGDFETQNNPEEVSNISVDITKKLANYYDKVLYFGVVGKDGVSQAGISEIWYNVKDVVERQNMACLDEDCEENYPIKNCTLDNIIVFKLENNTRIIEQDKCVYIYAPIEEQTRAADAFLFEILI